MEYKYIFPNYLQQLNIYLLYSKWHKVLNDQYSEYALDWNGTSP